MKTKNFITALLILGVAGKIDAQITIPDNKHVNVGVVYPVSSNGRQAKSIVNCFSLNLLAGFSAGETGLSLAGISNIILDSASGVQIAGFSNHIGHYASGVDIAGFMNTASKSSGLEIAGFANINSGDAGNQLSGFINKANTVGSQLGGFINVAKKVRGVQIAGLINFADSSDYPIALFNFIKHGEMFIGVSTDETLTSLVTFRSGGRRLYGIAGLGYNHKGSRQLAAWEAGIGGHLVSAQHFRLNAEAVSVGLTDFKHGDWAKSSLRLLPAYRPNHRIEIFAGPTFNYLHADKGQSEDLVGHYLWSRHDAHGSQGLFFGITGGINISLINN
jgi:hypothetical protein